MRAARTARSLAGAAVLAAALTACSGAGSGTTTTSAAPSSASSSLPRWATSAASPAAAAKKPGTGNGRLAIPSLGVDAPVLSCGTEKGVVEPPADVRATCLWTGGMDLEAAQGTSVIVGHSTRSQKSVGALERIAQMHPGDQVTVGGRAWKVAEVLPKADKYDLPTWVTARTGARSLALITCTTTSNVLNDIVRLTPA